MPEGAAQLDRLIDALDGTAISPRPLIDLELPEGADHLMADEVVDELHQAAVLLPIVERSQEPHLLLTQRSDSLRRHAGEISFPGGRREPEDANLLDTALRESWEEIGLQREHVRVLGYLDDYPTITGFRITPVVGLISTQASIRADGVEVTEVFEVPLSYLLDEANYQRHTIDRHGVRLPYFAVTYNGYRIWGATAAMLQDLLQKVAAP